MEEIRGTTWDLEGEKLKPWQGVQRLFWAGWTNVQTLVTAYATMMGESSDFLKAWHHNVVRTPTGEIVRDEEGRITIRSTDLGYIQKNVIHNPPAVKAPSECAEFAHELFDKFPDLADGKKSAVVARALYVDAGKNFSPWYAYENHQKHVPLAVLAVANFLDLTMNHGSGDAVVRR